MVDAEPREDSKFVGLGRKVLISRDFRGVVWPG
jgi:hypothetical protein